MSVDAPVQRPPHLPPGVWAIEPGRSRVWVPTRIGSALRAIGAEAAGRLEVHHTDVELLVTLGVAEDRSDSRALRRALFGPAGRRPLLLTASDPLPLAPPRLFLEGMVRIGGRREEARLDARVLEPPPEDLDLGDRLTLEVRCALGSAWESVPPRLRVDRDARLILGLSAIKVA
jgi:hypothetical protein